MVMVVIYFEIEVYDVIYGKLMGCYFVGYGFFLVFVCYLFGDVFIGYVVNVKFGGEFCSFIKDFCLESFFCYIVVVKVGVFR